MKKTYVKPMVAFENFQMTSNIAGNCVNVANSTQENNCLATQPNGWAIYSSALGCDIQVDDDKICYHVPTADTSIYSS